MGVTTSDATLRFVANTEPLRQSLRELVVSIGALYRSLRSCGVDLDRLHRYGIDHYLRDHAPKRHPRVKPNRRRTHRRRP